MDTPKHFSPREVFLHLLAIVTLYMGAGAFGSLLFDIINKFLPDPLENPMYGYDTTRAYLQSMRWSVAVLVIVFPVYIFTVRFLRKLYTRDPAQAARRIRKWLVYLTLFLAAVAIIIDLVTLVYTYLGGEFTLRFVLKVGVVLLIACAIFGYYFFELKQFSDRGEVSSDQKRFKWIKAFVWSVISIVVGVIISGFVIVGSPQQERLNRFDDRRVSDLQTIQNETVNFWQKKERLPANLDELKDSITGFVAPIDPQTNSAYEYRATDNLSFELCAQFSVANDTNKLGSTSVPAGVAPYPIYTGMADWTHGVGKTCFTRTIDPQKFPPERLLKR